MLPCKRTREGVRQRVKAFSLWRVIASRHFSPPRGECVLPYASEQGVILIALLWVLTALSLLALNLAFTVRTEANAAQASGEAERCYFYARGGLEAALYRIIFPSKDDEKQKEFFPYAGGMNHYWMSNEDTTCHVAVLDEAGKIDLNFAKEETLARLLANIGVKDPLNSSLAEAIVKWREPQVRSTGDADDGSSTTADEIKHRPFTSVEELLLIKGMTQEILYGMPKRKEDGKVVVKRGLAEYVTVYGGSIQININYAEPEVIGALPGLDLDTAQAVVEAREEGLFKTSGDLSQRIPGMFQGEALSMMTTQLSQHYCLIATAFAKGSKARRSIKTIVKRDETLKSRHEKLIWYDEYWPSDRVLKWAEREPNIEAIRALSQIRISDFQREM
jgi:general secretion pathway protein K